MKNITVVGIDWQKDFMDIQNAALPVNGATNDARRFKNWALLNLDKITQWSFTQDSHHILDISHPLWWNMAKPIPNADSNAPLNERFDFGTRVPVPPFTPIPYDLYQADVFRPNVRIRKTKEYMDAAYKNKEFMHFVWPEHCIIGTWGHTFHEDILDIIYAVEARGQWVEFITKGSNPYTEHFGAFRANVEQSDDPSTQFNQPMFQKLQKSDEICLTGQAKSHCVLNTLKQMLEFDNGSLANKIVVLEDCTSNVPGLPQSFYDYVDTFYADAKAKGVRFETTVSYKF